MPGSDQQIAIGISVREQHQMRLRRSGKLRHLQRGEAPNLLTITLDILLARPIRGVRLQSLVAFMVNLDDRLRPSADNSGSLHPGSNHGRAPRIHVQRHGCASCPLISDICQDNVRTVAV